MAGLDDLQAEPALRNLIVETAWSRPCDLLMMPPPKKMPYSCYSHPKVQATSIGAAPGVMVEACLAGQTKLVPVALEEQRPGAARLVAAWVV